MVSTTNRARSTSTRPVVAVMLRAPLLALALAAAGCGGNDGSAREAAERIDVFAAASLAEPFTELAERFEADNPGIDVALNLGGSSALREQILEGAPADVFASANEPIMDELVAAEAITGVPIPFATNRLALAVPTGNPGAVTGVDDLARPELLVGLCAEGVPCGDLARRSLDRAGVVPAVDTNESDVRSLLNKIAIGELDVGLVYTSDVFGSGETESGSEAGSEAGSESETESGSEGATGGVVGIPIPERYQATTAYPIAVTATGDASGSADRFVGYVTSEQGRAVLADHGFGPP